MQTRYVVTYIPTVAVETAAYAAGMKDGDGSSLWDWTEQDEHEAHVEPYATFEEAIGGARASLPMDVFGEVRITRERVVKRRPLTWDRDAVWHIYDGETDPVESEPDHVHEPVFD